jgi:sec-independent protein translocase protein TatA
MGGLSIWHWLIVLAVVLILFGTGRVGSLLGELGKGVKSFKQNISDGQPGTLPPRDASMLDGHAGADPVVQRSASGTTIRNG